MMHQKFILFDLKVKRALQNMLNIEKLLLMSHRILIRFLNFELTICQNTTLLVLKKIDNKEI